MKYSSIPELFAEAQTYLYNASEQPEIQKKMNQHGFTPKRFLEGTFLLDDSKRLHSHKTNKYGEKQESALQVQTNEQLAKQMFVDHVDVVKFVFRKDPAILAKFDVERIATKVKAWTHQAVFFYSKAEAYADVLAQHGLTQDQRSQASAMVEAVATARNQRLQKKGEAEEATRTRDQSVKVLRAWMKDFRATARIALKDSPQLLEAIGIVVKTKKV